MIYLDSAATSPALPCARDAFLNAPFGNPSSEHAAGQAARKALEQARDKIALCIGAEPEQIVFTSGSTEACQLALYNLAVNGCRLEISPYEHHAASEVAQIINDATYSIPRTTVGFVQMLGNNETGELLGEPEERITARENEGITYPWFSDLTAVAGHYPVNMKQIGCTFAAFTAHKFGGVPGAGVLYSQIPIERLSPVIVGGGQERGLRSGTENLPAICAMAAALEWQTEHMEENTRYLATLRQLLFQSLSRIPDHKWNTQFKKPCLPHILNISFDGVDAHALALMLSREGIMVSPGAACSNGLHEPSHVIMAMFHDEARARSAIRISLSHENTADEIVQASQKIAEAVSYLRSLS